MKEQLKLSSQLCFPLYAVSKEVVSKYTPLLKPYDLTYTQYIVLLVLFEERQLSVNELGNKVYLDSGTLSPLLKKLENKGLLARKRLKNDERVVMVSLTEKGQLLENKLENIPYQIAQCFNLEKEEALTLYSLLYKLLSQN